MTERPNALIAATMADAKEVVREFPQFWSWHIITPRNKSEIGWVYGKYVWTPEAQGLPARTRWNLRQRLRDSIDEHSEEQAFPCEVMAW